MCAVDMDGQNEAAPSQHQWLPCGQLMHGHFLGSDNAGSTDPHLGTEMGKRRFPLGSPLPAKPSTVLAPPWSDGQEAGEGPRKSHGSDKIKCQVLLCRLQRSSGQNPKPTVLPTFFSCHCNTNTDGRTVQEAVGSDDGPPTSRVILRMSLPLGVSIDLATKRG